MICFSYVVFVESYVYVHVSNISDIRIVREDKFCSGCENPFAQRENDSYSLSPLYSAETEILF